MPDLLHEFWRSEFGGSFGPVSKASDDFRTKVSPDMKFVFEVLAASYNQALRLYEERAYDEYGKTYDPSTDTIYTEPDLRDQLSYLAVRGNVR